MYWRNRPAIAVVQKNQDRQMAYRKFSLIEDDTDAADVLSNIRGIEYRFYQL